MRPGHRPEHHHRDTPEGRQHWIECAGCDWTTLAFPTLDQADQVFQKHRKNPTA